MGSRGPQPQSKLSVIDPRPPERPKPFQGMSKAAVEGWERIVDDLPAGFFAIHELDQLRAYCEAAAANASSSQSMASDPEAMKIFKTTAYIMASLGTKLRLNKNSKLSNRDAAEIETGKSRSRRGNLLLGGKNAQ